MQDISQDPPLPYTQNPPLEYTFSGVVVAMYTLFGYKLMVNNYANASMTATNGMITSMVASTSMAVKSHGLDFEGKLTLHWDPRALQTNNSNII